MYVYILTLFIQLVKQLESSGLNRTRIFLALSITLCGLTQPI